MIKVLFLPLCSHNVTQSGWSDSIIENKCSLEILDFNNMYERKKNAGSVRNAFIAKAGQFKPDLIFMQIQHTNIIDAAAIQKVKQDNPRAIVVNWTGDVRSYVPKSYKAVAAVSDYNLISSTGQIPLFENEIKKKVQYLQIGYDPKLFYPEQIPRTEFQWDISFAGNVAKKDRHEDASLRLQACKMLKGDFGDRFGLVGDGWPKNMSIGSRSQTEICKAVFHKSFCNLSINHYNNINTYFSDRLLMVLASGRPVINYRFPGSDSYFTEGCDLVTVNSIEQIPQKVKMLKANPELANFIGKSGAAKVFAEHTYYSRVKELLKITGLR